MKSAFSTLALTLSVGLLTTISSLGQGQQVGTINRVQIKATFSTASAPFGPPAGGFTSRETVRLTDTRYGNREIIEALQLAGDITDIRGWNVVEVFNQAGTSQGFFAYNRDFAPIAIPSSIFTWTGPTNVVTTYNRLSRNEMLTRDETRTMGIADTSADGKAASGTSTCTSSLRSTKSGINTIEWTTVKCTTTAYGVSVGEFENTYVKLQVSSNGGGRLENIQTFLDVVAPAAD